MTDAEKVALTQALAAEVKAGTKSPSGAAAEFIHAILSNALRAARNEALEEGAKTADELFGLGHHPMLISGARQAAAAIRSKKDAGSESATRDVETQ